MRQINRFGSGTFRLNDMKRLAWAAGAAVATTVCGAAMAVSAPTASATISSSQIDATTYRYSLTLTDTAGSANTIGTFWFAWVPGEDFLDSRPLSVSVPAGWTDNITNGGASDGFAIQLLSGSAATDVSPGVSLSGFSFTSHDTPAQIAGNSNFFPTTPVLTSFAYDAAPFSDAGDRFVVSTPEPASLGLFAAAACMVLRRPRPRR